jgi:integrase
MLIEDDRLWEIKVRRKGDSQFSNPSKRTWGNLMASPDLILNTLMYIADERAEVVRKHRDNHIGYVEPDEVFLSETYTIRTRGVLQTDSLTAIGVSTFKRAGIENAGPHRFRARFAVRVVEELVDALLEGHINLGIGSDAIETLMTMASERMSHMSPRSIRPYINFVLARRLRNTDAHQAASMGERIRQLGLRELLMTKRLDNQACLHEIASFIREGKTAAAICALKSLTSSLEAELVGAG